MKIQGWSAWTKKDEDCSAMRLIKLILTIPLINAPILIYSIFYFSSSPLFNLDYFLGLFLLSLGFRLFGFLFILFAFVTDFIVALSANYLFINPKFFLQSFKYGNNLNILDLLKSQLPAIVCAVAALLISLYITRLLAHEKKQRHVFLKFYISCFLIVLLAGKFLESKILPAVGIDFNLVGSPSLFLYRSLSSTSSNEPTRSISDNESVIQKYDIYGWAKKNKDRSVMFIIVESLGRPIHEEVYDYLKFSAAPDGYRTYSWDIRSKGATTSGELRSLCNLQGSYTNIIEDTLGSCLPVKLSSLGWETSGFHGFSGNMFNRKLWWPDIGLRNLFFPNNSELFDYPRCGDAFNGVCDYDLLKHVYDNFNDGMNFNYILTLNTHLPVAVRSVPISIGQMCRKYDIPNNACIHIANMGDLLSNIRNLSNRAASKPLIIIVGDHPPPFDSKSDRLYFTSDITPAFVFEPIN